MAKYLRYIDEAGRALERQHNADNREIIRELRTSADQIFDLISGLEETQILIEAKMKPSSEWK